MFDSNYKLAELSSYSDALESIRKLEQQLTDQIGSPISLIAYETDSEEQ